MDFTKAFTFVHGTKIVCGLGAAGQVAAELQALDVRRPLIATDRGIVGAGLLRPLVAALDAAGLSYRVFDEVESNPVAATVERAAALVRDEGWDSVIGVGGGSSIDTAKAVAMLATNPGTVAQYEGVDTFRNPPLPLIAVPTTVGTGSEVTRGIVITDPVRKAKTVTVSVMLFPRVAILDPSLVANLPGRIAAWTGMDALTQAIEAYISRGANPITDALNIHAVKLIANNLRAAVAGNDLQALAAMQIATTIEGIAFHNAGLGLVHAMANTVGGHFNTPHGLTNAVLLPYVLRFNLIASVPRYAELAEAMGERTVGLTQREAAERFIHAVRSLAEDVGVPEHLSALGVTRESLPRLAAVAVNALDAPSNPRRYSEAEILALFEQAL